MQLETIYLSRECIIIFSLSVGHLYFLDQLQKKISLHSSKLSLKSVNLISSSLRRSHGIALTCSLLISSFLLLLHSHINTETPIHGLASPLLYRKSCCYIYIKHVPSGNFLFRATCIERKSQVSYIVGFGQKRYLQPLL